MKALCMAVVIALGSATLAANAADSHTRGSVHKDDKAPAAHKTSGTVKKVDSRAGTITLAHEPVKSLNWPAMSMPFRVADRAMLDKISEGRKVEVEFEQRGNDYVITKIR